MWIADPGDAQYLNSTEAELEAAAAEVRDAGMIELADGYATATSKLLERLQSSKRSRRGAGDDEARLQ